MTGPLSARIAKARSIEENPLPRTNHGGYLNEKRYAMAEQETARVSTIAAPSTDNNIPSVPSQKPKTLIANEQMHA